MNAPWPSSVIYRYIFFQIPGWTLWTVVLILIRHWLSYPWWVIPLLLLLWVIKDALLFPLVWPAYDIRAENRQPLIGSKGVVVRTLSPQGYIQIRGELWRAETEKGDWVPEGNAVRVEKMKGLTLVVEPVPRRLPSHEVLQSGL